MKFLFSFLFIATPFLFQFPQVLVSGALRNIMLDGDLSAHINLDTLDKKNLFGLGPVAGLKGEILVLDGVVYSTSKNGKELLNQQDKISDAAMLVYSNIQEWKIINTHISVNNYSDLEKLVEKTAKENDLDTELPFAFKIETSVGKVDYHIIDWVKNAEHTMDNHKQFAYTGSFSDKKITMLGFFSKHHQSIITHHTSFMHIHVLEETTRTVGHLDDIFLKGTIKILLPLK